ncbi:hypothetical protein H3Z83_09070 [Tenacibaculum sp. S7007]|uniref:Uncharacterized protein n=1 Tax=Tenacibaculum pelagium TaxID=2759527 RepID=A0A839ANJ8_9FLAO|nr:hypothetical protein [Tenacibaculum pelagium]MBA6156663.1 hypothetical protein [Tenacibaculum pelagium]
MKYFDLIYDECLRINKILDSRYKSFSFLESSLYKIIYENEDHMLIFGYYPERYEYGKSMFLKGLMIQTANMNVESSLVQIVSFFKNDCKFFEEDKKKYSLDELLNYYDFYRLHYKNYPDWEFKYQKYLKEKYPW